MTVRLTAIYTQLSNKKWEATIKDCEYIQVLGADDLETAKVILRIITAEEVAHVTKNARTRWDIVKEEINYYDAAEEDKTNFLKDLL